MIRSPSGSYPPTVPVTGPSSTPVICTGSTVGAWLKKVRRMVKKDASSWPLVRSEVFSESIQARLPVVQASSDRATQRWYGLCHDRVGEGTGVASGTACGAAVFVVATGAT